MLSPEERLRTIREQVDSKIHWGSTREDVASWLAQKHGIVGDEAEQMLNHAYRARHVALRERALVRLFLSIVGLVGAGIALYIRYGAGTELFSGKAIIVTLLLLAVGIASLATLLRSLNVLLGKDNSVSLD